jgi:hypothetical protein
MKKYFYTLLLLLLICTSINAQSGFRARIDEEGKSLILESVPTGQISDAVKAVLSDGGNYKLYKISVDDPVTPSSTEINLASLLVPNNPISCNQTTGVCLINLTAALPAGNYALKIGGIGTVAGTASDAVPVFYALKPPQVLPVTPGVSSVTATIVSSLEGVKDKIRVQSKTNVTANQSLTVLNKGLQISPDNTKVVPSNKQISAAVEDPQNPGQPATAPTTAKEFTLLLDQKLSKGRTNALSINGGIVDANGNQVKTEGSVEIPGLPKAPDKFNFEFGLSSEAAVHQKPFFNLAGKYNAQDQIPIRDNCFLSVKNFPCYWQPQITADLGLGNTKAKNSIIIDLPFRSIIHQTDLADVDPDDAVFQSVNAGAGEFAIPRYYAWQNTDWNKGAVYLFVGPKFEADRTFGRINTLGSLKLEFKLHRLLGSIANKRSLLLDGPPYGLTKQQASLVKIKSGFSLVPFIGTDFGKKVTTEVIEKNSLRELIAPHSILRGFAGFNATFEREPFGFPVSLSFDERLFYLGKEEIVGTVIDNRIDIRRIKGLHPRSIISFDFYFNQVRRYSFNVTYENGRSAPNFEYLNKLSTGFKVVY